MTICAPCTPHASGFTPPAASPCTTIPATARTGSITGTIRSPRAPCGQDLLHDLGLGDDPGIYLPSSPFSARVHGHTLVGAGHPALGTSTRVVSTDPLLTVHYLGDIPVALTGIDAASLVREWMPRLHQPAPPRS